MNQIEYLFVLFCALFLIEDKAINILLSFVALIITTALILPIIIPNNSLDLPILFESEYFSYALILVQVSALTILFGFIIMLFPNLAQSNPNNSKVVQFKSLKGIGYWTWVLILLILLSLYLGKNYNALTPFIKTSSKILIRGFDYSFNSCDTLFLRKLGILLYSIDIYIIKLIVLTIILLLAIISLFFIIL